MTMAMASNRRVMAAALVMIMASVTTHAFSIIHPHIHNPSYKCKSTASTSTALSMTCNDTGGGNDDRRHFLNGIMASSSALILGGCGLAPSANAKVEGYAPPSKSLSEEYRQGTAALGDSDDNGVLPREAYKKLPSGVVYADTRAGNGAEAVEGSKVNIQWVLRKSNGYFVDSSAVDDSVPFIFTVGDGKAIAGVDEGIRGMKVGGARRLLIPPSLAYVTGLEDGKPGPLPKGFGPKQQMRRVQEVRKDVPGEYIYLEVQLTRVR